MTAQSNRTVTAIEEVCSDVLAAQLSAALAQENLGAIKSGLIPGERCVEVITAKIKEHRCYPFVLDPVLVASSGKRLADSTAIATQLRLLGPYATVITPNINEVELLTSMSVHTIEEAKRAGCRLLEFGTNSVLVKGGHLRDAPGTDLLVSNDACRSYQADYIEGRSPRGTGCAYASSIACFLASGCKLEDAVARAKQYITEAIRQAYPTTDGFWFLNHFHTAAAQGEQ